MTIFYDNGLVTVAEESTSLLDSFLNVENLPPQYTLSAIPWFLPYTEKLRPQILASDHCYVLGINGAQGTGKSTLARLIQHLLTARDLRVVTLSIDDFYLSKKARIQLAEQLHPLLATRGVPGTHDIDLAINTLSRLTSANEDSAVVLPQFDKASDELIPREDWPVHEGATDLIILEGWFVGAEPQQNSELDTAINQLESAEDGQAIWRRYVNEQLAGGYQQLFANIDNLVMLAAPGFEQVSQWRNLQEEKLAASVAHVDSSGLMTKTEIARFVQHFQRLTLHCLKTLPAKADTVFLLDETHQVISSSSAI